MSINMIVSKKEVVLSARITIERRAIEKIKIFIYLTHLAADNGNCNLEIKRRLEKAKGEFNNISTSATSKNLYINQEEAN